MTDQSVKRGMFHKTVIAPIIWLAMVLRSLLSPVWWTFPIVVAVISFFLPLLGQSVRFGAVDSRIGFLLIGQIVILGIWLVANMLIVNHKDTTTSELQYDHTISVTVTGAMLIAFGALMVGFSPFGGRNLELYWGYLVPLAAAIADVYFTGHIGLNNAAQKPFLDRDRG